ncbi:hypothetical protein Cabys_1725 [Caldithrix abyssi DSM 13497]|uniref:Uncharacterized protein n=1 Tax=Caldithrix abyssi DSM 13497 TaxID=880073 RepID=A0A1J1C8Z8_CALAY|nr:hypothetical protein Cabys_1725 [Caldithrix abyssi DSM 13497]
MLKFVFCPEFFSEIRKGQMVCFGCILGDAPSIALLASFTFDFFVVKNLLN